MNIELATVIARIVCNASNYPDKVGVHVLGRDMSKLTVLITESVEAAGYGKLADAWDEGSASTGRAIRSGHDYPFNPYRKADQ